ncbi:hypothetical protein TCAL_10897 [Tigriopus californicus]|uniref:Protein FAM136A n=1 Tax=Tigriopus californicus TaxID=6832 RepID=A0A553NEY1_TIGCA|nr:protein FAM136A-like [Tigriopus californicus]TRY63929.1 hypothetical protein TCAL_10897 [Tigriopus californicus]|eukprot:TCALIF_10897-PA protein Name:"Similar to fam136a Protein FAM136A (Xenopus tropicalis)" AED:0.08 eAED:0.08 QI:0/-1/0/1/-1/1/1/0/172
MWFRPLLRASLPRLILDTRISPGPTKQANPVMAQESQAKVEKSIKAFINDIDRTHLRSMEQAMHECAAQCCAQKTAPMDEVHGCVENCQKTTLRAQQFVQEELGRFQQSLSQCVMACQDRVKDKVTPESSQNEITQLRGEFETCAIQCCDTNLARLPDIAQKIGVTLKSDKY